MSRRSGAVDAGAGWLLGLVGYALFKAYVDYGPSGPKAWLRAKFLNKPMKSPGAASGSSSSPGWSAPADALTEAVQNAWAQAQARAGVTP